MNKGGRGTFDDVMRGLAHLRRAGVEWNALTTCTRPNADRGREVYRLLRDGCGAGFVQFIPIVERLGDDESDAEGRRGATGRCTSRPAPRDSAIGRRPRQYGRFLIDVFEDWVRRDVGRVYVQMFEVALAIWAGEPPACASTPRSADGRSRSSTPATSTRAITSWSRATASGTSPSGTWPTWWPRRSSSASGRTSATPCPAIAGECDVASPATAAARRTGSSRRPTGEQGLNYLCAGYMDFFHHVGRPMRLMSGLLARRRPPAEIMRLYASEDDARGRYDPCPCGSGRKWKFCHGSPPA